MTRMPSMPPAFSIVVPVFNGAATIAQCIDSLLTIDYPSEQYEIICVDNASTDDTAAELRGFLPHIRILREEIRGAAAARNCGIVAANHDLIAFTDADCIVDAGWLRALASRIGETGVGIVGGRIAAVAGANSVERFGERIHDHRRAIEELRPPYVITMNWASPKQLLVDVGLFDESLLRGQDTDLAFRIGAAGWRMVYVPDAVVRHFNERSLRGLFCEGYTHGRYAPLLRSRHARTRVPQPLGKQMWKALLRAFQATALSGPDGTWRDHLYALTFNSGKAVGEIWTLAGWAPKGS
jgi:glycosyltransferase involved in cell wall biosynthesis